MKVFIKGFNKFVWVPDIKENKAFYPQHMRIGDYYADSPNINVNAYYIACSPNVDIYVLHSLDLDPQHVFECNVVSLLVLSTDRVLLIGYDNENDAIRAKLTLPNELLFKSVS